jgi:hypothetical protein
MEKPTVELMADCEGSAKSDERSFDSTELWTVSSAAADATASDMPLDDIIEEKGNGTFW